MSKIKAHMDNIALSHSVFALPFAYMGLVLASGGWPSGSDLLWVTVAMVGARSAALALNNLIDLKYDRLHPRFKARPMVTGAVKPWEAVLLIAVSLAVFFFAASHLHPICIPLAPVAVIPFTLYPYMKRISWTCHLVLGLALSIAPIGAWMAVKGELTAAIVILGLAVAIWIAAFDVIYGSQDVLFDGRQRLHSMPLRFGLRRALFFAKLMHGLSILCFLLAGALFSLAWPYYIGVACAAAVLVYQHRLVEPDDLSRVTQAYFMRNGLVSILVFVFTLISLYM
ncbi:UbiA-like polyprenyltransferase [Anaeroarcus burkinensis]|uniref:UbiA-like polyprenyltransferase n=1 Tax=Anaeroarcus burkinensis TaxID=82376 RepID=UPI000482F065|nr:UbiA-like polyprenyltransferase [Anaeroarcus burkinensis]